MLVFGGWNIDEAFFHHFRARSLFFVLEHFCCVRSEHVTVPLVSSYGVLSYLLAQKQQLEGFFQKMPRF